MLYEKAYSILNGYPRPRVRVTLVSGEVLETPRPMLACCSKFKCVISTDGIVAKSFRWEMIRDFELIPFDPPKEFKYG